MLCIAYTEYFIRQNNMWACILASTTPEIAWKIVHKWCVTGSEMDFEDDVLCVFYCRFPTFFFFFMSKILNFKSLFVSVWWAWNMCRGDLEKSRQSERQRRGSMRVIFCLANTIYTTAADMYGMWYMSESVCCVCIYYII